nr:uncharacterized protein LOC109181117 [Ipomoea batatas]
MVVSSGESGDSEDSVVESLEESDVQRRRDDPQHYPAPEEPYRQSSESTTADILTPALSPTTLMGPPPITPTAPRKWPIDVSPLVSLLSGDVPADVVMRSLLSPCDIELCWGRPDFRPFLEVVVCYGAMEDALVTTQGQLEAEIMARLDLDGKMEALNLQCE